MAPKRASRLDAPPAAPSPQDSEGSDSGSESESESESVQSDSPKGAPVAPTPPPAVSDKTAKAANSKQQSSSEGSDSSGSETDGESESESASDVVAEATPKPISTKPMQEAPKSKQPRSKGAAAAPAPTSGSKRPREAPEPKQSERPKKKAGEDKQSERAKEKAGEDKQSERPKAKAGEEPRPLFQRIWGDADEIAILEGMLAYAAQKGESAVENMDAFYDFIKKSLKVDVKKRQLKDKVSRLNKRYATCVRKGDKYKPVKAHDVKIFDLLMKVWGGGGGEGPSGGGTNGLSGQPELGANAQKKAGKSKNPAASKAYVSEPTGMELEKTEFDKGFAAIGFSEYLMKDGMKLVPADKRAELNAKWKELHVAELELLDRRSQLISKQTSFVLQQVKSAKH